MREKMRRWFGRRKKAPTGWVPRSEVRNLPGSEALVWKRKVKVYDPRMKDLGGF